MPTPMLFAPPHPPVRLAAGAPCVLGRSSECGLPLDSGDASRQHAEVSFDGSTCTVTDLGSTNGTFVNGEPLTGSHELRPGDRIEIGSRVVTFCEVDERLETTVPGGGDTIVVQRGSLTDSQSLVASQALQGDLGEIPPFAVFQLLEMGTKSGLLEIESDEGPAQIWLEHGRPVHAVHGKQLGVDAAFAIARIALGRFRFEPNQAPPERTIDATMTALLLEATRQLDEES